MLAMGGRAPEFTLPDQDEQSVSLSTFLRHGTLILYFYPADFTPGCTREACAIRDLHEDILQVGLQVVGVSPQSPQTHRAFREKHRLPFTLLSDMDKSVDPHVRRDGTARAVGATGDLPDRPGALHPRCRARRFPHRAAR